MSNSYIIDRLRVIEKMLHVLIDSHARRGTLEREYDLTFKQFEPEEHEDDREHRLAKEAGEARDPSGVCGPEDDA